MSDYLQRHCNFLKSSLAKDPNRDTVGSADDNEIESVCTSIGKAYLLLDSVFSFIYRIRNRPATEEEAAELKDRMETLSGQWIKIGLSFTPKMHVLIDHFRKQISKHLP